MNKKFITPVQHNPVQPVSVERIHPDRLAINGVHYDGDYFRAFANPETDVLYAVRRDEDGCVRLTVIPTIEEAARFFEEQGDCFAAQNKSAARNDIGDDENAV